MGRSSAASVAEMLGSLATKDIPDQSEQSYEVELDRNVGFTAELEAATNLLMGQIMPELREFFNEVADVVLHVPRWQLMVGSVLAQHMNGSLPSPFIDPSWSNGVTLVFKKITCAECGEVFDPKRLGQTYCSNACGVIANKKARGLIT